MTKFEVYTSKKGEYRWRLKASNGRIIADSGEGYKTKKSCMNGLDKVRGTNKKTPIIELE